MDCVTLGWRVVWYVYTRDRFADFVDCLVLMIAGLRKLGDGDVCTK